MVARTPTTDPDLYQTDEVAWLEAVADAVRAGRWDEVDPSNLAEYLTDMARSDRREVVSRLRVLLTHLLKWDFQEHMRSRSWRLTVENQRRELVALFESATLRRHAEEKLADVYQSARGMASAETTFDDHLFPTACPYTLDQSLTAPLDGDPAE